MIRSLLAAIFTMLLLAGSAWGVDFKHDRHLEYLEGPECITCHRQEAPAVRPDPSVCGECHDPEFIEEVEFPGLKTHGLAWSLNHGPFAKGNTYDCSACHTRQSCLDCHQAGFADEMGEFGNNMNNVHRSDFHVSHPIAARTNQRLCSRCHEKRFCNDCHNDFAPADLAIDSHRRGWSDISVSAASHANFTDDQCQSCHTDSVLPSHEWTAGHAREARKNLATCQACHPQGDVCLTCHSARTGLGVNPHPEDWDDFSDRLDNASGGRTCRKCH